MSFCPFCGKEVADGAVCSCQAAPAAAPEVTPVAAPAPEAAPAAPATETVANKIADVTGMVGDATNKVVDKLPEGAKGFLKKNGKFVGIGVAAVIVLIILFSLLGGSGYKDPINSVLKAVNKGEKFDYVDLMTAGQAGDIKEINKLMYEIRGDEFEDEIEDIQDSFEKLANKYEKWKLTFEFTDSEKLSKDKLKDFQEELEDLWDNSLEDVVDELKDMDDDDLEDVADAQDYDVKDLKKYFSKTLKYLEGFKKVKVSEGYKVKGYYALKDGGDEVAKTNKDTVYILKINGTWMMYSLKESSRFRFNSDDKNYDRYGFLNQYLTPTLGRVMDFY